ncbi:MAG: DNA polymerase III subunit gamma/tau, partial [Microcystaceae cyanobacterium]
MAYEPIHHKYRPQTFADLVGQEAIATTLTNALLSERIAPAYLLTGPRGTGKTSSARILAKSLNCMAGPKPTPTPCGVCETCRSITRGSALDVIEIDAASNTGVDNIREIIERSQFSPVQCRFKVYVIDECHMLSTAAFNALLKTLEEPPESVIFVLATTDPQRVLPTIISRCQRFDYRRIPLDAMVSHLRKIADLESINIDQDAITLVAQLSNGGLRDAESLLDQLSLLSGTISPEKVWDLVGAVPEQDLLALLNAIASDDSETVIDCCRQLMNRGREPLVVLQNLAAFYLNLLIAKNAPKRSDLIAVTSQTWDILCQMAPGWDATTILMGQQKLKESEFQLRNSTQPRLWLEVTLLGLLPSACQTIISDKNVSRTITNPVPITLPTKTQIATVNPVEKEAIASPESDSVAVPTIDVNQHLASEEIWEKVLQELTPPSQALIRPHGVLMHFDSHIAQIGIKSEPLLRIAKSKQPELEKAFEKICGQVIRVTLIFAATSEGISSSLSVVAPPPVPPSPPVSPPRPSPSPPVSPPRPPVSSNGNKPAQP